MIIIYFFDIMYVPWIDWRYKFVRMVQAVIIWFIFYHWCHWSCERRKRKRRRDDEMLRHFQCIEIPSSRNYESLLPKIICQQQSTGRKNLTFLSSRPLSFYPLTYLWPIVWHHKKWWISNGIWYLQISDFLKLPK